MSEIADVLRYWAEVEEFLSIVRSAGNLAIGEALPVPPIKITHSGKHYTIAGDRIIRES